MIKNMLHLNLKSLSRLVLLSEGSTTRSRPLTIDILYHVPLLSKTTNTYKRLKRLNFN